MFLGCISKLKLVENIVTDSDFFFKLIIMWYLCIQINDLLYVLNVQATNQYILQFS